MRQWFVADFETTNAKYYIDNGYTKVWLYAVCDENGHLTEEYTYDAHILRDWYLEHTKAIQSYKQSS